MDTGGLSEAGNKLIRLAEDASLGSWSFHDESVYSRLGNHSFAVAEVETGQVDAELIATMNPSLVSLLAVWLLIESTEDHPHPMAYVIADSVLKDRNSGQ